MQAMKVIFVLSLTLAVAVDARSALGAPKPLEGADLSAAKDLLTTTLTKVAAGDGPSYQVVNVISVSSQLVAGSLHKFQTELSNGSDNKECIVKIWNRPWLAAKGISTNVKIQCKDEPEIDTTW
ncbi:cystatin-like protein [Drosophila rhopaloa]|uniref:Cystatin-like protein n=1 Tax=Drosophila rhopaloa TaxID=1041015 RepID=A0A6P4EJ78_DRORH|nr:cystatin-like protein [Drosophila rhopaloa]